MQTRDGTPLTFDRFGVRFERGRLTLEPSWLSFDPAAGSVVAGASQAITVVLDATGLAQGRYEADLCVRSNDPYRHTLPVHVTFDVGGNDTIFASGFEAP